MNLLPLISPKLGNEFTIGENFRRIKDAEPWYNVKDYGAKGDGVTDDTAAIQAACNAAGINDQRGSVYFPPSANKYLCVNVDLSKATGSGPVTLKGSNNTGTRIGRYSNTGHVFKIINTVSATGWQFEDIQIDGTITTGAGAGTGSTTYDGIYTEYVALCNFVRTYIGHNRYGVNLALNSVDCVFNACTFGSGNVYGFAATTSGTDVNHRLLGCWFDENLDRAFYTNAKKISLIGCQFLSNTNYHAYLDTSSGQINFIGCQFAVGNTPTTAQGIFIGSSGNQINGGWFDSFGAGNAIIIAAGKINNGVLGADIIASEITDTSGATSIHAVRGGFHQFGSSSNPAGYNVDSNGDIRITGSNKLRFGGGNGADADSTAYLYRLGTGILETDGKFYSLGGFQGGSSQQTQINGAGQYGYNTAPTTSAAMKLFPSSLSGTDQRAIDINLVGTSQATAFIIAIYAQPGTVNAAFTAAKVYGVYIGGFTKGAASTVTNHWGIFVEDITQGGTKNAAIETGVGQVLHGDDVKITTAGKGLWIKPGTNGRINLGVVLVAGTKVVANTSVTATTVFIPSVTTVGGVQGILSFVRNAGVGYTINSSNIADTSTVDVVLIEAA